MKRFFFKYFNNGHPKSVKLLTQLGKLNLGMGILQRENTRTRLRLVSV
jgi:hypothetical protein